MRRSIIIVLVILALALIAAISYWGFGRGQSSPNTLGNVTVSGYDAEGEPATLAEVLDLARQAVDEIDKNVHDYSAVIRRRERVGGILPEPPGFMYVKVREKPFSAYLNFLAPADIKGREVIYIEGCNDGNLIAHTPGVLDKTMGTMSLPPTSFRAMWGERHPITQIGIKRMCEQLIEFGEKAKGSSRVKVLRFPHARINDRPCTCLQIMYPGTEPDLWGFLARVFLDNELKVPIRIEVYELPKDRSKGPQLIEEYTYLNLQINRGIGDTDFDPKNPKYNFP